MGSRGGIVLARTRMTKQPHFAKVVEQNAFGCGTVAPCSPCFLNDEAVMSRLHNAASRSHTYLVVAHHAFGHTVVHHQSHIGLA